MQESDLIYDWNIVDYEFKRNPANHPPDIWCDDETLRDGLQSPSARTPTIAQKMKDDFRKRTKMGKTPGQPKPTGFADESGESTSAED